MIGTSSIKPLSLQTPEDKVYILKLIAHQKLGAKWIYFRKIKRADQNSGFFGEKSLMEQMKATRAALRFTTKNARKLYRFVYQETIKEIKGYTGLKTEFPELPESESGNEILSLTSSHDAVIIGWTPIKFLLPIAQLRSKGLATQRHTEGLAAKLFFKVAGYYAEPSNWDRYQLNFYLRRLSKNSTYQEVVSELEPLKSDLDKFIETYELFKFGKASLSKDITADTDAFDDAMGMESFESQLSTLYWHHFIYAAIEQFLFRYYLTLVSSTASQDAIRYLTAIFEPVLQKAVENRDVFLGSFETDRSKRSFRVPYQRLVKEKAHDPLKKNIKTQMGVFETFTYTLPLLKKSTISYELNRVPEVDSEWGTFIKLFILHIDKPSALESPTPKQDSDSTKGHIPLSPALETEKKALQAEKEALFQVKKELSVRKEEFKGRADSGETLSKDAKITIEEEKANLLNTELELDKKIQKLKEKFKLFDSKLNDIEAVNQENLRKQNPRFADLEAIMQLENELSQLPCRQYLLMHIMTTIIHCVQAKKQARLKLLERFKERVVNDQELETKRIEEIRKKAEKKLREMKKRKSKMDRLKQDRTVTVLADDIKSFESGIEERIEIIKKDSTEQQQAQKQRLNHLFEEVSKEKTINLDAKPKTLWKLITTIDQNGEFCNDFPQYVSKHIQSNYTRELEPFYKTVFEILDLSIKNKLLLIQSLEKSGIETSVKLVLNEEEEKEFHQKIETKKAEILTQIPDLFTYKVVFLNKLVPINDLFRLSIDNKSTQTLLQLKMASPKTTKNFNLKSESIKSLIELNILMNPLPKFSVMQAGKENEKSPEKRVNSAILNSLLAKLESQP